MKRLILLLLSIAAASPAFAEDTEKLLRRTAICVKALIEKGHPLENIVTVTAAHLMSSPPKDCIMVITERKPNDQCPDDSMVGPFLDQGSVAC